MNISTVGLQAGYKDIVSINVSFIRAEKIGKKRTCRTAV